MLRKTLPLWLCAAIALGLCVWVRSAGTFDRPEGAPPPPPTPEEIQAAARGTPYVEGQHGGTFRGAISSDIATLNYALSKDATTSDLLSLCYNSLLEHDPLTYEPVPLLAREVPTGPDDPDGLVWTFHLREGALWSDGAPLTAHDVAFTFEKILFNESIATTSREAYRLEVRDERTGETRQAFMKVEALDDLTVRFTCPRPWGFFLTIAPYQWILPRHVLERHVDEGSFNTAWTISSDPRSVVGCGPFRLDQVVPGERVVLVRNPHYHVTDEFGKRLPYLDRIVYEVTNSDIARKKFLDGELDASGVRGEHFAEYRRRELEGAIRIIRRGPSLTRRFLAFNMNLRTGPDGKPFLDPVKARWFRTREFRQAVSYAIDRDRIRTLIFNDFAYVQLSTISQAIDYYWCPDVRRYPHDMDRARGLLDGLGYTDRDGDGTREDPDGHPIRFVIASYAGDRNTEKLAALIQEDLAQVGIEVTFRPEEFNHLVRQLSQEWDWESILIGFTGGWEPHTDRGFWTLRGEYHMWNPRLEPDSPGIFDWERRIHDLFDEMGMKFTIEERRPLSHEWQRIAMEELPVIYTVTEERLTAISTRFGNVLPTLYQVWDDRYLFILGGAGD
ncbi:MAG: ABC transporter substrate-binding protein [Planctomycetes bacterium]|nr:ABC transporter substrate-binding protein [Planctomycetota bacterium]